MPIRTDPSALAAVRLRTSPNGAAISELCRIGRPSTAAEEQGGLVEPVVRLGQRDVVDPARRPVRPRPHRAPGRSRRSSSTSSSAPVRQKKTDVSSGAATADRSASPAPTGRGSSGASIACARTAAASGFGGLEPDRRHRRSRSGARPTPRAALSSTRASPCDHSCTGLRAVLPGVHEAQRGERRGHRPGRSTSSTASSANANPTSSGAAGTGLLGIAAPRRRHATRPGPAARCPRSTRTGASSDRCASTAARPGSDCRNTSLNTSSDSGPV